MAMKKKPVTGMKDIMPREMEIRDYCIGQIKETYRSFGFSSVETPCVEHIENLSGGHGGENEKLIFKILKRGEKLKIDEAKEELKGVTLESIVIATRSARAVKRKIALGELRAEDFPLLMHIYEIIVEKKPVHVPWAQFETESIG